MEHVLTMASLKLKPSLFTPRPNVYIYIHKFICTHVVYPPLNKRNQSLTNIHKTHTYHKTPPHTPPHPHPPHTYLHLVPLHTIADVANSKRHQRLDEILIICIRTIQEIRKVVCKKTMSETQAFITNLCCMKRAHYSKRMLRKQDCVKFRRRIA